MNALRELLLQRMRELGVGGEPESLRKLASRGEPYVSLPTLSRIYRGVHHGRLNEKTLKGLAVALKLDVDKVREAAEATVQAARSHDAWLPERALGASPWVRRQAVEYIDYLMEIEMKAQREQRGAEPEPPPPPRARARGRRK